MKRIITCSDGTWNLPGDSFKGHAIRTNIQKIFEAICNEGQEGINQIKYYDEGVGVEGTKLKRMFDGMTGRGLDRNILDAYKFICWNYSQGDELYLFGFSRGAYTARSLAGLIRTSGLVKNNDLVLIKKAYEIYRDRSDPLTHPDGDIASEFRLKYSQPEFRIKFIGVWDTVGSLGIPLKFIGNKKRYEFHDTTLSSYVDYAYQALALDEKRKNFEPTIWHQSENVARFKINQVLEQKWFAGVHSNIGGGYPDEGLSDVSLDWMISKARAAGLSFEQGYLRQNIKPEPFGVMYNSFKFPFSIMGKFKRQTMTDINSYDDIHPSVYDRMEKFAEYRPENVTQDKNRILAK